jgi:hypothetical protein
MMKRNLWDLIKIKPILYLILKGVNMNNPKNLFNHFEKELGRKLTIEEENMIGGAYYQGRLDFYGECSSSTKDAINTYNKCLKEYKEKYSKNDNYKYIK